MEDNKLLTIIIPAYNEEKHIERVLNSILLQDVQNFKIIVVNDGSKDNTLQIMKEYKQRFEDKIQIIDKPNTGLSDSRNVAVKKVDTEYFVFLDADDFLDGDSIRIITEHINKNKEKDIILDVLKFSGKKITEEEEIVERFKTVEFENLKGKDALKSLAFKDPNFLIPTLFVIRTNYYLENNFSFELGRTHEDYGLMPFVIMLANNISSIKETLYNYVLSKESITRTTNKEKIIKKANDVLYLYLEGINRANYLYLQREIDKEALNITKQVFVNGLLEKAKEIYKIIEKLKEKETKTEEDKLYMHSLEEFLDKIKKEKVYRNINIGGLRSKMKKALICLDLEKYLKKATK